MAVQVIPVRVGDVEVLAATTTVAGSEPTSGRAGMLAEQAGEAFGRAQDVIVGMAVSTAQVIGRAAARAARPDRVEVEFGLGFTAKGNIVIGGASAEATLRILLSYDAHRTAEGMSAVPADSGLSAVGDLPGEPAHEPSDQDAGADGGRR